MPPDFCRICTGFSYELKGSPAGCGAPRAAFRLLQTTQRGEKPWESTPPTPPCHKGRAPSLRAAPGAGAAARASPEPPLLPERPRHGQQRVPGPFSLRQERGKRSAAAAPGFPARRALGAAEMLPGDADAPRRLLRAGVCGEERAPGIDPHPPSPGKIITRQGESSENGSKIWGVYADLPG